MPRVPQQVSSRKPKNTPPKLAIHSGRLTQAARALQVRPARTALRCSAVRFFQNNTPVSKRRDVPEKQKNKSVRRLKSATRISPNHS